MNRARLAWAGPLVALAFAFGSPARQGARAQLEMEPLGGGSFRVRVGTASPYDVRMLSETSFHVRQTPEGAPLPVPELMVVLADESRPAVDVSASTTSSEVVLATARTRLTLSAADDGALRIRARRDERSAIADWLVEPRARRARWTLAPSEHVYGFGDKRAALDQRGHTIEILNHDAFASETNDSYKSIPFFFTSAGYGVFFHDFFPSRYDVGAAQRDALVLEASEGPLDFFAFLGPPAEVLAGYTELTGRPALLPRWFFGFHQGKAAYEGRDAFTVAARMRAERLPVDVVYYDDWIDAAVERSFVAELWKQHHVRLTVGGNPFVIGEGELMDRLAKGGHLLAGADGHAVLEEAEEIADDEGNSDVVGYVDFFDPDATRAFFEGPWERAIRNGVFLGMADFGELDHVDAPETRFWPSNGLSVARSRNLYGLAYGSALVGAAMKASGGRSTGMVRPGFAGSQRLGWTTTGDSLATYGSFRTHVRALANLTLSGFSNVGTDVGGWDSHGPDDLYARWLAAGAFSPFLWAHGQGAHEPYSHGPEVERVARTFLNLRYRLVPYLYSLQWVAHSTGLPILRAFPLAVPDDAEAATIDDELFLGDGLLVAPVFDAAGRRAVRLPRGDWYDFFGARAREAGERTLRIESTPLDRLPVFARGGTILVLGPEMQYTSERPLDPLTIRYYALGAPGSSAFTLYEDDGETRAYENGAFQETRIRVVERADGIDVTLDLTSGDGTYRALPRRTYAIELIGLGSLTTVTLGAAPVPRGKRDDEAAAWGVDGNTTWILVPAETARTLRLQLR